MNDLAERLAKLEENIATAAHRSGRDPASIKIIAVSKTQTIEAVQEALRAGLIHLGENKVQEARGKIETLGRGTWHLIGHLQTNKAKDAVRLFDFIDSVDRLELAEEINRRADGLGKTQNVLLQVNMARESTKFGCAPELALDLAKQINNLPRLTVQGLMTIAPLVEDTERVRSYFAGLRELRDKIQEETGLILPELSMGMSGDFIVAVEEGSTSVRIGQALFGARSSVRKRSSEDPSFLEST